MKKQLFLSLFLATCSYAAAPNSGTIIIYQNSGSELGSNVISGNPGNPGNGFLQTTHGPATYVVSTTIYMTEGTGLTGGTTWEAPMQVPFHAPGTMSGLWAMVTGNSLTAGSTLQLRINGVNGTEQLLIPSGSTGEFRDTTHSDVIHAGDKVDLQLRTAASGTSLTFVGYSSVYTPTTNNMVKFLATGDYTASDTFPGSAGSTNGFATFFISPAGTMGNLQNPISLWSIQTETIDSSYIMKTPGTFSNFQVYITTNATIGNVVFHFRKNLANGSQTITVPAGQTGLFEDNTNTDSVVSGDTVTYSVVMNNPSDGKLIAASFMGTEFVTTGKAMEYAAPTSGHNFNPGDSNIMPIQGALGFDSSEVNDYNVLSQQAGTFSNMHVYLQSNTLNQAVTINFRKNAANCGLTLTIPAGASGYFEDTTHTCAVTATDELNYKETVPAGTGQAPFNFLGATFTHN